MQWHQGTVVGFDPERHENDILFDDGDRLQFNLAITKYRVPESAPVPTTTDDAGAAALVVSGSSGEVVTEEVAGAAAPEKPRTRRFSTMNIQGDRLLDKRVEIAFSGNQVRHPVLLQPRNL